MALYDNIRDNNIKEEKQKVETLTTFNNDILSGCRYYLTI